MKRSNRLVARSAVALSLAASLTACGTASSTTTTAVSSEAATETASETEAASTTENVGEDVWLPYNENLEKKRDDRDATGKKRARLLPVLVRQQGRSGILRKAERL